MPSQRFIFSLPAALLAVSSAFLLSSCEQLNGLLGKGEQPPARNQVTLVNAFAIIDLDEIARRLGRDQSLRQALQIRQSQLSGDLNQVRNQYLQQARNFQEELGEDPSEEDQKKLVALVNQMNQKLSQLQQQASQSLSQDQITMIQNFRNEVRPHAVAVARERGFATILIRNDNLVFAYDPASNITEEIVRRMGTPMVP